MKVMIAVFTHNGNVEYLKYCLQHIARAMIRLNFMAEDAESPYRGTEIGLMVIDFTEKGKLTNELRSMCSSIYSHLVLPFDFFGIRRPSAGFCSNMNFAMDFAFFHDYDRLVAINDDAFIHSEFIVNALKLMDEKKCSFIGGIPQEDGQWNTPLSDYYLPQMDDTYEEIENFARLWWEMSACAIDVFSIHPARFDLAYDEFFGLCGDNDFLVQLAKVGHRLARSGKMRFWHSRGVTQEKFGRNPFSNDIHRKKVVEYVGKKWGVDISDISQIRYLDDFKGEGECTSR